jgi:hypothetical protein
MRVPTQMMYRFRLYLYIYAPVVCICMYCMDVLHVSRSHIFSSLSLLALASKRTLRGGQLACRACPETRAI